MIRLALAAMLILVVAWFPLGRSTVDIQIGSKKFTESVVLGEILQQLARATDLRADHYRELGGTRLVFDALLQGDIDLYPEYTGTIVEELYAGRELSWEEIRADLSRQGIGVTEPLGFNNTYAIGMLRARAEALGITQVSQLRKHPDLIGGMSNEFIERADGWPGLRDHYSLPQRSILGMDQDLAYRQLQSGAIDFMDAYSTDAKLVEYDIVTLEDDADFFPRYDAVTLYRQEMLAAFPDYQDRLLQLEGKLSAEQITQMNAAAESPQANESDVAAAFLQSEFGLRVEVQQTSRGKRIWQRTGEHLNLVRQSLLPAILLAIPLGVLACKLPTLGQVILAVVAIVQTVPALALLVMLLPITAALGWSGVGVGSATAVTALLLYSLLPIVRATHAALGAIEPHYLETAQALGLPARVRLLQVELPLALPGILAGIKTAAVLNVGFATLGALIGAGGYGQPILSGIRLNDTSLILEGAVPAAALAIAVQALFATLAWRTSARHPLVNQ
ncbi:glycine betaine ABC transporter substrate-binding protein [Planctomycetaceae bacterium SH139]